MTNPYCEALGIDVPALEAVEELASPYSHLLEKLGDEAGGGFVARS